MSNDGGILPNQERALASPDNAMPSIGESTALPTDVEHRGVRALGRGELTYSIQTVDPDQHTFFLPPGYITPRGYVIRPRQS
ncbi:MAG: hypothetical protein LBV00_00365 [Propionibacteriaceae bacterium]|nr:hypothetical protein [Propionibacteriaceae bacterium]